MASNLAASHFVDITAANPNTTTANMPITTSQGVQTVPISPVSQGSRPSISIPATSSASVSSRISIIATSGASYSITTTSTSNKNITASSNTTGIAGGVAGGIGGLVMIGLAGLLWRRKRSRDGPVLDESNSVFAANDRPDTSELPSDMPQETPRWKKIYNLDDPITFPKTPDIVQASPQAIVPIADLERSPSDAVIEV
ncbi:hypothetical protein CERSUDRAFT_77192 [Gelatoporia subvermispora B]|uniref:Mid2 domain-containing protein n=1 Tax=Ceriporiopsis subvermispora (strain B) TaxID=914234 RepID=M2R3L8_CERS8|nr:hypothetical protein CERSUDRAFT_77192 [Gelatoporia subvermispora B]